MKKLLCFFLGVVLMLSLVSIAWAEEEITDLSDQGIVKMVNKVDKANMKISDLVAKAVADAEKKIEHYSNKVMEMEVHKDILGDKLDRLTFEIGSVDSEDKSYDRIHKEIEKISERVNNDEDLERLTQKLEADINKIIAQLVQHTNKIADKVIEAGKKEEIVVECSIIEVVIGTETVLIDPLRIRGY